MIECPFWRSSCMHAMGLDYQPQQLRWAEHKHHIFDGNKMRFGTDCTLRGDTQWRAGLHALMIPLQRDLPRRLP